MYLKFFIINKGEKFKLIINDDQDFHYIDVNAWFKANNLLPHEMNQIRQFIFEEWISKKIQSFKNKIKPEDQLFIIFEHPTDSFITFLNQKINSIFETDSCEIILFE